VVEWIRLIDKARSRSIWMLLYCTGCGAMELPPAMTSRFDMERFGIMPMATPRQADVLLVTGYVTKKTLKRIIYAYEQMPAPKWLVAHGSCPINGGVYWDSHATVNRLDLFLPVDLYVAGCMPRAEANIKMLTELMDMVARGEAKGWELYQKNYEYYKENQRKLFGYDLVFVDGRSAL
jgi:NADH-quinone oxidoreductase subunit B